MSKTIIVGSDFVKMDILALNLKMYVGTETTVLDSVSDLKAFLKLDQDVGLVILESDTNDTISTVAAFNLLKEMELHAEFCILGDKPAEVICKYVLPSDVSIRELVKTVAKIFDITAADMTKKPVGEYVSMPLMYFENIQFSICDVFVKIEKKGGEHDYIRRFDAGKTIAKHLIKKYQSVGITKLFIPSEFRLKFTNFYSEQVFGRLNNKNLPKEEQVSATRAGLDLVAEDIESLKVTEKTIKMAEVCIRAISKIVSDYPKLGVLLRLLTTDSGYIYKYCQILTYVMSYLVDKSDWGSKEQIDKLSFVIFFQDIALCSKKVDGMKLQKIRNQEDLKNANLNENEEKIVTQHALMASNLVKEFQNAPLEADVLIKQHHGSHNGIGFPLNVSSTSSNLILILKVAQDFTDHIMNITSFDDINFSNIISTVKKGYTSLKLKKIVDNLDSIEF